MSPLAVIGAYLAIGMVLAVAILGAGNFGAVKSVGPRIVVIVALFWPFAIFAAFVCGLVVTFGEEKS